MTLDERLELARLIYPPTDIDNWCIYEGAVVQAYKTDEYGWVVCTAATEFSPSLTGDDRQKVQALDVIVAAFNLGVLTTAIRENYIQGDGNERYFFQVENLKGSIVASVKGADLLHASALALLGDKT